MSTRWCLYFGKVPPTSRTGAAAVSQQKEDDEDDSVEEDSEEEKFGKKRGNQQDDDEDSEDDVMPNDDSAALALPIWTGERDRVRLGGGLCLALARDASLRVGPFVVCGRARARAFRSNASLRCDSSALFFKIEVRTF